jgi:hypothetical protein
MSPRAIAPAPQWGNDPLRTAPSTPLERRGVVARPFPPDDVAEDVPECFVPDPICAEWIRDTFVAASGPLANEDHAHLLDAAIGVLWTNAIHVRQMRQVLATAEIPTIQAGGWKRARFEYQLREWFGPTQDFVLTFSAPDCLHLDDRAFCALVEHELYHCAQAVDAFGTPKFHRETGRPIYAIRGHDVEEFTGVVRRYGATSGDVRELVHAANQTPILAGEPIAIACGTCLARSG